MPSISRQQGFALLVMMVVLIGAVSFGLAGIFKSVVNKAEENRKFDNRQVLLEAKELVLSYAVDYAATGDMGDMGKLPCPDVNDAIGFEGWQDLNCGVATANSYGYFPFKTFGRGKIEDAENECLWYVVSGDYKNSPDPGLLNPDSLGYLNVVDENGVLQHGATRTDYPVALIISPGKNLGQNRSPSAALPECQANFNILQYLEGGPDYDYPADLPGTENELWTFLSVSEASRLGNNDFNDQVIAIYKSELWGRIKKVGDLDFTPGVAASTKIENLTKSLAECLAAYGDNPANSDKLLPLPAPLDLADYRDPTQYNDDSTVSGRRYGRFPQVLEAADSGGVDEASFVFDSGGVSYCEGVVATSYDDLFWNHWKDHFFYILSDDFANPSSGSPVAPAAKCSGGCFEVNSTPMAAMVIFAGEAQSGQSRIWWWDAGAGSEGADEKADESNYLEGDYVNVYDELNPQDYDPNNSLTDYAYCVSYDTVADDFSADVCPL